MGLLFFLSVAVLFAAQAYAQPANCARIINNTYICNWTQGVASWTNFNALSAFGGEIPQTLNFTNVNGQFSNQPLFSTFNAYLGLTNTIRSVRTIFSIDCNGGVLTLLGNATFYGEVFHPEAYITNCNITYLPEEAFIGTNFTTLSITGGYLHSISPLALKGLTFQDIDYSGNLILDRMIVNGRVYPTGFFKQASNLRVLSIRENDIRYLTRDVIEGVTQLQSLDLSGNFIDAFSEGIFDGLNSLWFIDLSYLPLDCSTCTHNVWLFDWADAYRVQLDGQMLCTHPEERKS